MFKQVNTLAEPEKHHVGHSLTFRMALRLMLTLLDNRLLDNYVFQQELESEELAFL